MATAKKDPTLDSMTPEFLAAFNKLKKDIETSIQGVQDSTKSIATLTEQVQRAFDPDDIQRLQQSVAAEVKKAQTQAQRGKALLDQMKDEQEKIKRTNPDSERVQAYKHHYLRMCKTYVDVMKDHQKAKEKMRQLQTDDIVRRGHLIVGDKMTEAEIREAAERDPSGFVREMVITTASDEAHAAYAEAQSRARDIEQLIRSINEVASMFQDLASLVQHQTELLDSIENNVDTAVKYMKKGNQNLKDAITYQKKTRKCYCCIIIVVIVIIILLVSGLGSFFGGAFKSA